MTGSHGVSALTVCPVVGVVGAPLGQPSTAAARMDAFDNEYFDVPHRESDGRWRFVYRACRGDGPPTPRPGSSP